MKIERDVNLSEIAMLKYVVDLYVKTCRPVSSRGIKSAYGIDMSTANIRGVLHRLEEKGYLYKPHISAGRIPTDLGYRLYVDEIKTSHSLNRRIIDEIRKKIGQDWDDVRDVMSRTSLLLGELTSYMGLIMGIFNPFSIVEKLRIIQLEGNGGLVQLKVFPGRERKIHIEFPKRYASYIIDRAVQIINERIAGHSIEEAPGRLENFLKQSAGIEREIAEAVAAESEYLFDLAYDLKYSFKGLDKSTDIPELSDPKILRNLVRIMGERSLMLNVMKGRMGQEVLVTIGSENEIEELEDFSVVTHRFSAGDCSGLVGVLGPTRMSYDLVLAILNRMAEELHRQF